MKVLKIALATSILIAASQVYAVNTDSGNPAELSLTTTIHITEPITMTAGEDMTFEDAAAPNSGQLIVYSNNKAEFSLTGEHESSYLFTVDAKPVCRTTDGDRGVRLTGLQVYFEDFAPSNTVNAAFNTNGDSSQDVAGQITIYPTAVHGDYTCNYTVSAIYE